MRRKTFSNTLLLHDYYSIICVTETCLTRDIPNAGLFLNSYNLIKKDTQTTKKGMTKHGGVLLGIKNNIAYEEILLPDNTTDVAAAIFTLSQTKYLFCVVYNPPEKSPHLWSIEKWAALLKSLNDHYLFHKCKEMYILGDINFGTTDWDVMNSSSPYENQCIALFNLYMLNQKLRNIENDGKSLDVVFSKTDSIINVNVNLQLHQNYSKQGTPCSDHFPYSVTVQTIVENHQKRSLRTFNYSSEKLKLLNHAI